MQVNKLTMRFLADIKKRRSENTHRFYEGRLVFFERWFGTRELRSLKKKDIEKYLKKVNRWPDKTPKAPDTQRGNIAAWEQLQKWAIKHGHLKKPILDDIDKPAGRTRELLPTPDQVEMIKKVSSKEFRLVYEALRRCGARPMELAQATVAMWDRAEHVLVISKHKTARKTGKPRKIAVGEVLEGLILESLGDRTEGPLFRTPTGLQWKTSSLSAAYRKARDELGLDGKMSIYCNRHCHASAMHPLYGDLATQISIGHATGVLGRYAQISIERRKEMQDSLVLTPQDLETGAAPAVEQQKTPTAVAQEQLHEEELAYVGSD